jgi:predicted small lipoprotein YifL
MRALGIMLLFTIILQGCGRKGPLVLPPAQPANPAGAPAHPSLEKSESKK